MRVVKYSDVVDRVRELCIDAAYLLDDSMIESFKGAIDLVCVPYSEA